MNQIQRHKLKQNYKTICTLSELSGKALSELFMVFMDDKPGTADCVVFDSKTIRNLPLIQKCANSLGLFFATSDYKYITNSPKGIFTEIPLDDNRLGKIVLSFSKSAENARKGAVYFHKKMLDSSYGYRFGELMGYPKCCLKFGNYLCNNSSDPDNFGYKNPPIESLKRSKHFDWRLNIFSPNLLPHTPCSLTCKESIKYVNKVLKYYSYIDKKEAKYHKNILSQPASLYWTIADRILLYGKHTSYTLGTGEICYHKIESMITSDTFYQKVDENSLNLWKKLYSFLEKGNRLIVTNNYCKIFKDQQLIFELKKDNPYIPILIKPDILP